MRNGILLIINVMLFACMVVAQQDTIIHGFFNGEQTQLKIINFDQDSADWDLLFHTRMGDYNSPPIFRVANEHGNNWTAHVRSDYGALVSSLDGWTADFRHEYASQGAIHEVFLTAVRNMMPDGSYCYGWISYRVDAGDHNGGDIGSITFYEYYYCPIPNYPFHVGQTSVSWDVEENEETIVSVYPNPAVNEVMVSGLDLMQIDIYNAIGQRVINQKADGDRKTIDLSNQPPGIYFVNVTDKDGKRCVKKVIKR